MRPPVPVPFVEWTPDLSTLSGMAQEAKGVISQGGHYAPLQDLSPYKAGTALPGACIGARGFWSSAGSIHIFLGNADDLYKLVSRSPTVVSKAGGYTASESDGWQFEQFGNYIVAVNANVAPQVYEMGVSALFADLAGSPPTSKTVFRVQDSLCLASGRTLSVSGFNNIELWDYATATQGVQVDVDARGGNIQTGVGGEIGLIFQERGIVRMTYVGPSTVFQLDTIEWKHGAISRESVSQYGRNTFFASETGLYVTDGMTVTPIGDNRVDRYFSNNLNYSARGKVTCAIDYSKKLWKVAFPTSGSTNADHMLIYSMSDNRWTHEEIDTQMLFEMPREGVTLDDVTEVFALEGTTDADEIMTSVDSPQWKETRVQIAAVDGDGVVSTFEGSNRAAVIHTSEFEPTKLRHTNIDEIWPEIDIISTDVNSVINVRSRSPRRLTWGGSTLSWGDTEFVGDGVGENMFWGSNNTATYRSDMNEYGFSPFLISSRYLQMGLEVAAGAEWTETTGLQWRGSPGGW